MTSGITGEQLQAYIYFGPVSEDVVYNELFFISSTN